MGVFSHGFTLGKDGPAASRICKQLAAEGIANASEIFRAARDPRSFVSLERAAISV